MSHSILSWFLIAFVAIGAAIHLYIILSMLFIVVKTIILDALKYIKNIH